MAELISEKDIKAPLQLAGSFDTLAHSVDGVIKSTEKLQKEVGKGDTFNALNKETKGLIDNQQQLVKVQGQMSSALDKSKQSLEQLAPGTSGAVSGIYAMVKASLAFIATPIGLVVAALGAALYALTAYFKGSEEGQNRLNKIVQVGKAIFEQFMNVVEAVGKSVFEAIDNPKEAILAFGRLIKENIINRFEGILEFIPAVAKSVKLLFAGEFKEAGKVAFDAIIKVTAGVENASAKIAGFLDETIKLVDAGVIAGKKIADLEAELDRRERSLIVDRAKTNLEVSKLREKATQLEGDAKRKAIEEAISLEQTLSNKEVAFAKLNLELAKLRRDTNGDDKEALKEVADAQGKLYDAQRTAYDNTLKFNKQLAALRAEEAKKEEERRKKLIKDTMIQYQAEYDEAKKALDEKTKLIKQDAIDGLKTREDADKEIKQLNKALADDYVQIQIDKVKKSLAIAGLSKEEELKLNEELYKLQGDLQDAYYEKLDEKREDNLKKTQEDAEKVQEIYSTFADAATNVFNGITEARLNNIDAEQNAFEDQTKRELELAGDNEERKKEIEENAEKRRKEFEKKRIEAQRRQAIFDKIVSAIQAAIATAVAVTKALPNIPLAVGVGIAGAIEVGLILAKQIPQYKFGTKNHPGGLAVVGDGFLPELVEEPGKAPYLSADTPTIMDLSKGTKVTSGADTMELALAALMSNDSTQVKPDRASDTHKIVKCLNKIEYAIQQKDTAQFNISRQGAERLISNAQTKTYFLNTFYK